jgi:hypothetical protein
METVTRQVLAVLAGSGETTYRQDVATALAAFTALGLTLWLIAVVIVATYQVLRVFTKLALHITALIVVVVVMIGLLNR